MYRAHGDDALMSVGVLFICFAWRSFNYVWGSLFFINSDGYFIDRIMGYQVGDYFLFRKVHQVLHHHFLFIDEATSGSFKDWCIFVGFS